MKENTQMTCHKYYSEEIDAPVFLCGFEEEVDFKMETNNLQSPLYSVIGKENMDSLFRGTSIDRLALVLQNGIDNEKTNQGFWGNNSLSKCLEYGDLILCYDPYKCKDSWKKFELTKLDDIELNRLHQTYLSHEISKDESEIFFSMFEENRRGRVHYEIAHGYYIPKPETEKESLKALILLGSGANWFTDLVSRFYVAGGSLQNEGKYLIDKEKFNEMIQEAIKSNKAK